MMMIMMMMRGLYSIAAGVAAGALTVVVSGLLCVVDR